MNTVTFNISLPKSLALEVDEQISSGQYASRSEFFRTLLRIYRSLAIQQQNLELVEFKKRPLKEIEREMMGTGKYSKRFVKGIVDGLAKSSVYANS